MLARIRTTGWLIMVALAASINSPATAADREKIQQAIDRGLEYLKSQQDKTNGTWPFFEARIGASNTGATALAGVTLLECGVAADDPAVRKAAEAVRNASLSLTQT